ncbi:MAG TPA: HlyD family type I secretion periplasmic adaptor subunit [Novosphingobium sp.]|nr:HlyD family type I secretion periplasmic adaptor subunit [Novosphingobium sp.]
MNSPMRLGANDLPVLWTGEEAPPADGSFNVRKAMQLGAALFLVIFLLAALVPIGGAVLGSGTVGVESRVKRIAHPFGGVIAEILVRNGQHVEKGQLLIRLDDKVSGADATYSSLTVEQLLAQRARLEAERVGASVIAFPPELTAADTPSARKAMEDEARLFRMRIAEEAQLRGQLSARVQQLNAEIASIRAQISAMQQQRALIEPERAGVRDLYDKDLVTINRLNQMERTAVDIDGRIASLNAQIAQTQSQIAETQGRAIQLGQTRRVEAGTELARVLTALNEQRVRSVSADDQQNRSEIRAPYSGTVEKIAFAAMGEVVRPAEPIMEIVPDEDQMVVEAAISPADIDQVRKGQVARVRFSAFNLAATPEIEGKVAYVATDRTDNAESRMAYYTVRIEVDQDQIRREGMALRSGMPADVHIVTASRSMLSYITKPIADQLSRAFRDR